MERQLDVTDVAHGMVLTFIDSLKGMDVKISACNETRSYLIIEYPERMGNVLDCLIREYIGDVDQPRTFLTTAFDAAFHSDYPFSDDLLIELPNGKYMRFRDWAEKMTDITPDGMYSRWLEFYSIYHKIPEEELTAYWNDATDAIRYELTDVFIYEVFLSMENLFRVFRVRMNDRCGPQSLLL